MTTRKLEAAETVRRATTEAKHVAVKAIPKASTAPGRDPDPGRFKPSNHQRNHASRHADLSASPAPTKVALAARLVREISPATKVTGFIGDLLDEVVLNELLRCDLILGCTDSNYARAALGDIAAHYLVPVLDLAVQMRAKDGILREQLGEIALYAPGLPCPWCMVLPTLVEPLRAEWANVRAAAITHGARSAELMAKVQEYRASSKRKQDQGDYKGAEADSRRAKDEEKAAAAELAAARTALNDFHSRLCHLKVLDPACGTGNFLYVALQQMKVLEGEVFDLAAQFEFGENFRLQMEKATVDPHQFLGLEINPRAASIAELVLWIGYLQWHFKLHGKQTPPEPILRAFKNIECRDAVLDYDGEPQPARDEAGKEITVWDRKSTKKDTVTGRAVTDETKRVPLLT